MIKNVVDSYNAPTPKWWKVVRNIFGTIGAIGVALIPFTGGASGVVGIVALVANIIAGSKTLTEEDVSEMTMPELRKLQDQLKYSTYGKLEGKAIDALRLVEKEIENTDRI